MIGKAAFWIGLLVLLTPHEPDLGLGRPPAAIPEDATVLQDHITPHQTEPFGANLPRALFSLREDFLRRVPQMRADIRDSLNSRKVDAAGLSAGGASSRHF